MPKWVKKVAAKAAGKLATIGIYAGWVPFCQPCTMVSFGLGMLSAGAYSASDYDYCRADPINCLDLDGRWGMPKFVKSAGVFIKKHADPIRMAAHLAVNFGAGALAFGTAAAFCAGTAGIGCVVAGTLGIGAIYGAIGHASVAAVTREDEITARSAAKWMYGPAFGAAHNAFFVKVLGAQQGKIMMNGIKRAFRMD